MPNLLRPQRTAGYKPFLAWFSLFGLIWTGLLLYAGGFTTSIGAGMIFPDWPLSNGSLNPEGWTRNQAMLAEHSHRLIGMKVGLITLTIAGWLWYREPRLWLRRLGYGALLLVIVQGLIGGMRVLFDDLDFAMVHACLAQAFLCVLVTIAAAGSRSWVERKSDLNGEPAAATRFWGLAGCATIFAQLVIGAVMRHSHAAMAIPTFPLIDGGLLPQSWDFAVGIHFAHRAMAVIVTAALVAFCLRLWKDKAVSALMRVTAAFLIFLLGFQILLGATIIWTARNPHIATWHVVIGALLFATTAYLTVLTHRSSFAALERAAGPEDASVISRREAQA